jgi:hypothetical protein
MSTPTQYPRTNIVKLNPPSTTTRDNTAVDGVSFYSIEIFIEYYIEYVHQLVSIMFFFLSSLIIDDVISYDRSFFHIWIRCYTFASFFFIHAMNDKCHSIVHILNYFSTLWLVQCHSYTSVNRSLLICVL